MRTLLLRVLPLILGWLLAHPAAAQVALVQSSGVFGTSAGNTASAPSFATTPVAGDTIVVLVWTWTEDVAATIAVSDSAGNSYLAVAQATVNQSSWYESAAVFYARVAATGAGYTVSLNLPNNDGLTRIQAVAIEYSGVGAVDKVATATGSGSTASVATSAAVALPNELVVGAMGVVNPASLFTSITPSSGYTSLGVQLNNSASTAGAAAYQVAASAAVESITWTTSPALTGWAAALATFKPTVTLAEKSEWHFDESSWTGATGQVIDASGNGYNGTAEHGPTTASATPAISGALGTCRYGTFDGVNEYVAVSGPHLTNPFTVTAWIQPTGSDSVGGRIWYDDTNYDGYAVSYGDNGLTNQLRFYIRYPATAWAQGNIALTTGNWYFIAGVLDATNAKTLTLYTMNSAGTLIDTASVPITGFTPSSSSLLAIGGQTDTAVEGQVTMHRFPGYVDEVTTYTSALTASQVQLAALATHSCSTSAPDHYGISDAGVTVNCQPSPVTIRALSAIQGVVATTDTITVSTSTGHGDWTLTSGAGVFTAGASNSGTATYTYAAADGGVVTLSLRDTYAETVSIHVTDGAITQSSGTALAADQQPLTFATSGFRITNGANSGTTIGTQVAGKTSTQSLALQAVRTDTNTGACTAAFASGATVSVGLAYQCNNPQSCIAGQTFAIANNGTTTNIAGNPSTGVSTYTTVPLKFSTANAEAPFTLDYSDAGQVTLYARYNIPLGSGVGSGNLMAGSSQFVVQPYTLSLSNIKCTTYGSGTCAAALASPGNNPGATSASGAAFIPAGAPFSATVTAQNYLGAATPNFGQETSPATVTLGANLIAPAGGNPPALNNAAAFGAFSAGVATGTTFNWPEVGIITLTPSVTNYLGSGLITGTTSGDVGRFIPASFSTALNAPVLGTACSAGSFSYIGQPLTYTVAPVATVTALNTSGTTTKNYTGSFLKLSNSTLTGRTYTPTPASPALVLTGLPSTSLDPTIADLGTGQATLTFSTGSGLSFSRGSAIAPFSANIALSINVIDADGVSAANPVTFGSGTGIAFSSGATQYYGRMVLRDSVGSELLDLPMPLTTQYYLNSTVGFTTNTADSCTTAPTLAFSNYQLNLAAGETCVRDTGYPGHSGIGCTAAAGAGSQYAATAVAGNFNLNLAAPGAGDSGALTVTATAPTWLQYSWAGGVNPAGLGTFGVFPAPAKRVYQREVY